MNAWYLASTFYEPYLMLESTADATTGNCCWVRFMNMEPRIPFINEPDGGEQNAIRAWEMNYAAISDAADAIRALDYGIEVGDGADATARTRAAALFALAGAHANLALLFDSAFVNTGAGESGADSVFRGYAEVRDSALALWDELIALTENASWQWDYTTLPTPEPITADRLNRIASTMAARTLLLASRTAAENSRNQWARILAYANGGISGHGSFDMDFAIVNDIVDWRNYIALYGPFADRFRVDQRLIHRMAPNIPATFNGLGTQPLPLPQDARLAIANLPCTVNPLTCTEGITADYVYIGTVVGDPLRGVYMQSPFWHRRYVRSSWMVTDDATAWEARSAYVLAAENDLMIAEALAHTNGDLSRAAALVNRTHVTRGGLPPVAATVAAILAGVDYERDVELLNTGGIALFDRRRVDGLQPGTIRHLPVPARVYEGLGRTRYTYGGVGNRDM
ncbi:MAG TPA: hypothetical protein VFG84_02240 [Gemmatimonadaceae bacterium]|nr:hypothetical protein [Gemmatimonadaceae bacterium]